MRNLKKILALVLALVMSMSVMSIASADFKDSDKVNAKFATAVEVLNGLKVFQGYEDGTFKPTGAITRAEVAAIIYRIDTGDVTGKQVKIYSDYNKFSDVKSTDWFAGYVNYCANALYIRGYDENTFGPNDPVTGYQALAMILRVVGYDKNGEFSGSAWQIETAKYANKLGITKNVDVNTLGVAATRELVAELLFRTITEVSDVKYTLLLGYTELDEYIGTYRFGLAKVKGADNWGRPYTGWTSNGKLIVQTWETPVYNKPEATTECDIADLFGGEDVALTLFENGVDMGEYYVDRLDTKTKVGAQGTILEIYSDRIVMIDTYLAEVTKTVKMTTDKAGHIDQYPYNEFTIYGIDATVAAGAKYDPTVEGNSFATGDYMLVMYNEAKNYIEPYAAPKQVTAKQTHLWWNAEKHTIGETTYLDNVNYTLDAAGYDKANNYVWFFDTNNNVIGSTNVPPEAEAEKVYAVVLGVQWINAVGENGYALGTVYYLNTGKTASEKIAYVGTNEMKYADAGKAVFANGEACTTYQYNVDTEDHLYVVTTDSKVDGLILTQVEKQIDTLALYDGVSQLIPGVYTDNNTVFFFYEGNKVTAITGYDNLPAALGYTCKNVDYVMGANGFVKYVYIPEYTVNKADPTTPAVAKAYEYVYITGDAMNYKLKDRFALLGVVDGEGNTDPLYFAKDYAGTEAGTEAALNELIKFAQDTLCLVYTENGLVKSIVPVALDKATDADATKKIDNAEYAVAGSYKFLDTGVLLLNYNKDTNVGDAINVNSNTTIINDAKVGVAVNDLKYIVDANLYVVYDKDNFAKYIFVTSTAPVLENGKTLVETMVSALTAADFEEVSATYVITADTNVTDTTKFVEAVEKSAAVAYIDGLTAEDVVVTAVHVETVDGVASFNVTIAVGTVTTTVTVKVALTTV